MYRVDLAFAPGCVHQLLAAAHNARALLAMQAAAFAEPGSDQRWALQHHIDELDRAINDTRASLHAREVTS